MTDLSNEYLAHRQALTDKVAAQELLARVQTTQEQAQPQETAEPEVPMSPAERTIQGWKDVGGVGLSVAKDIGKGVTELPRSLATGTRDAFKNLLAISDEVANWSRENLKDTPIDFLNSGTRIEDGKLSFKSADEMREKPEFEMASVVPGQNIENPESVTGGLVKGVTQFLVGFKGAGRVIKGGGLAVETAKGVASAATAFDPHAERLSDLVQEFPAIANPVTEYLSSDPTDGAAEGRLKNALEMGGLGLLVEPFAMAIKGIRQAKALKEAPELPPTLSSDAFKSLGDESQGVFSVKETAAESTGLTKPIHTVEHSVDETGQHLFKTKDGTAIAQESNGYLLMKRQDVATQARGQGQAVAMVETALQEAKTLGVKLGSDISVSPEAEKVYKALEKRGYTVTKNPAERNPATGNLVSKDPRVPVFEVDPKQAVIPQDVAGAKSPAKVASSEEGRELAPAVAYVNYSRIDTPEDVKNVIGQLANRVTAKDAAKNSKRTFAEMKLDAAHKDAWEILQSRREGQPLSDAESIATRELWAATTDKLVDAAKLAADNPSESNLFAFRKLLAIQDMVQNEVLGARASTARAQASWRIPVGSPAERMRDVQSILQGSGGTEVSRELAKRVNTLAQSGMLKELSVFAEKSAYAKNRDAILEAWQQGLLTNPASHTANILSNSSVIALRMMERGTAARLAQALGDDGSVQIGEAAAQWYGVQQGIRDMFSYYSKLARMQKPQSPSESLGVTPQGKIEYEPAISSKALNLSSSGWIGRGADMAGSVVRTPGALLQAEDEFFKTIGYRMELNAQAVRQAATEVNTGVIPESEFKKRIADIIENPPENVRMEAVDAALYQTFNNTPGNLAQGIMRIRSQYPMMRLILPFVRTPANILDFTFERTPIAPLMSKWRADVNAGGARRDLAYAQMGLGSMGMLAVADMVMSGQVTGRGPTEIGKRQAMEREGWKPYSFKGPDGKWHTYNRLDPVGSVVGMAADAAELSIHADQEYLEDGDTENIVAASMAAMAGNLTNKTYLSSLSNFIEMMNEPTRKAGGFVEQFAASAIPSGVGQVARTNDPIVREVYGMMDAINAKIPGNSKNLEPRLDLWGKPISRESGYGKAVDFFSPVYTGIPGDNPIDKEILRIGSNITKPGTIVSFDGATVDLKKYPKAYTRYVELSGNELKHPAWNLGAKDFLNKVVSNSHPMSAVYNMRSDGPEGGKDVFIRDTIRSYREMARRQVLKEFPEIANEVKVKREKVRALKFPVMQ